jgi:hypothetical protein
MRAIALIVSVAAAASLAPRIADAKGGGMQSRPNKDFQELIVKGERPEIAACMVAAINYARHNAEFVAIRWNDNASDRAIMQEKEVNGKLIRSVRLMTQMRTRGLGLFSQTWRPVEVTCEQPEDGSLQLHVNPIIG